jgi:hypothetical protein
MKTKIKEKVSYSSVAQYKRNIRNLEYHQEVVVFVPHLFSKRAHDPQEVEDLMYRAIDRMRDDYQEIEVIVELYITARDKQPKFYLTKPTFVNPFTGELEKLESDVYSARGDGMGGVFYRDSDSNSMTIVVKDEELRLKSNNYKENKMKTEKKENVIEIQDEVKISQEGKDLILEKGDKIRVLKEDTTMTWKEFVSSGKLEFNSIREFNLEIIPFNKIRMEGRNWTIELKGITIEISANKIDKLMVIPELSDIVTIYEDYNSGFKIQLKNAVLYCYY